LHAKIGYKFFHFCEGPKKVWKKMEKHEKSIEKERGWLLKSSLYFFDFYFSSLKKAIKVQKAQKK
jgi:hypothetical protein